MRSPQRDSEFEGEVMLEREGDVVGKVIVAANRWSAMTYVSLES